MQKLILLLSAAFLLTSSGLAEPWERTADLGLALTQSSYSSNWNGEETGTLSWTATFNSIASKVLSPKANWQNTVNLQYGMLNSQVQGTSNWGIPIKAADRIFGESIVNFTLGRWVDPYVAVTLDSQFRNVIYDPADVANDSAFVDIVETNYFSPFLLTEGAGVGRVFVENEKKNKFSSRLGLAMRQHWSHALVDAEDATNRNVESSFVNEGGLEWVTDYEQVFGEERMFFLSKLRLFQALSNSKSDELNDDWKTVDVFWDNTFNTLLTKYIQLSLFVQLLYDKEIDKGTRIRQTMGLGVTYSIF